MSSAMADSASKATAGAAARPRAASVDAVRVAAIAAVIAIHTTPFEHAGRPIGAELDLATVLNQATRFAVPFFLAVAGFFWARKVAEAGDVRAPTRTLVRRALLVWMGWWLIYLLPWNLVDALALGPLGPLKVVWWNLALAARRPAIALLEGTSPHLWFLVALAGAGALSALFLQGGARRSLAGFAAALYLVGLAGQAYPHAPFGFHLDPDLRNGHLFALAFFVTGVELHRRGPRAGWLPIGAALAAAGLALHLGESWVAHALWGEPLQRDYMAGTYFYGTGVAMMALSGLSRAAPSSSVEPAAAQRWRALAALGPAVLGIYASHMVFVSLLKPLDRRLTGAAWWEVAYVAAVFVLAWCTSHALARYRATRPLVI